MPTWTQEKETILGEVTEVQQSFHPRRGWTLEAKSPDGCQLKRVRVVRTADGVTHRLYQHEVLPEVMAECEAALVLATEVIRRTEFESDKVQLLLAIANAKGELARLEQDYAQNYAAREATAVPKV